MDPNNTKNQQNVTFSPDSSPESSPGESIEEIDLTKLDEMIEEMTEERQELTKKLLALRNKEEKARKRKKVVDNLLKAEERKEKSSTPTGPRKKNAPISNTLKKLIRDNIENGMTPTAAAETFSVCKRLRIQDYIS